MAIVVPYVTKYVTGSMMSHEYSHHVRRARMPNCRKIPENFDYFLEHVATLLRHFRRCDVNLSPQICVLYIITVILVVE